jgi:mRNA-degrading endonuclease RelE of RelBE toxin-antitoxin system
MMEVTLTQEAADGLDALQEPIHARILRILDRLRSWPDMSGAKPLTADLAGHCRIRTGDYRVQFRVEKATVIVEKIGHRDRFYDE